MNVFRPFFFLLIVMYQFSAIQAQTADWQLKKEESGIQVYTRSGEGFDLDEFKGETILNHSIKDIVSVLKSVGTHSEWIANCTKAELLKNRGDKMWVYSVTAAPFPVSDRDGIAVFYFQPIKDGMRVRLEGAADYLPEKEDFVRIPFLKGFWLLETRGENKTKITYQVHADPGGSIPTWLANATAVNNPLETLKNLSDYLN